MKSDRPLAQQTHLGRDLGQRGSVTVEYTVLLVLVAVGCCAAVQGVGQWLVRGHQFTELWLSLPLP